MGKLVEISTDPHLIKWIADYLRDKRLFVGVSGASFTPLPVISQGSIPGLLLFIWMELLVSHFLMAL